MPIPYRATIIGRHHKLIYYVKGNTLRIAALTNHGTDVRTQTYILPEKERKQALELEEKINKILSGDTNTDVCTLLSILNKKITDERR